jgi:L-fucose isomerase-like protein
VLTYRILQRKQATSWREYGAVQTEADVNPEKERISRELAEMASSSQLPLEILPLKTVENPEQAGAVAQGNHDVLIVYAAGGSERTLAALTLPDKWNLMFLRHRSGPVYRWYESNQPRFLRKAVDEYGQAGMAGMGVEDLVVDSQAEILMRLRALYGLKNTLGKRIVAVGEPGGWGPARQQAPLRSRELWKLDIVNVPYPDLGERIKRARQDEALVGRCRADADTYLKQKGVSLETTREFVYNAFVLTAVFRSLMAEAQTDAITINQCMSTIMPIAETTACVPLSLLNDEGYLAFCESDFVVIPSGILLHYISGKPVFLNNPTYPHDGMVTLMHCTAPRKMDGNHPESARILTHFESDYGAAPKVDMRKGQKITVLDPDFASRRWLGFEGEIVDNPFLAFCRSQIDVRINGNCDRLLEEMRGFHWMVSYGNYLRETGYALKKVGVAWVNLS